MWALKTHITAILYTQIIETSRGLMNFVDTTYSVCRFYTKCDYMCNICVYKQKYPPAERVFL